MLGSVYTLASKKAQETSMVRKTLSLNLSLAFLSTLLIAVLGVSPARAQSENVIHRFTRTTTDGGIPGAALIADKKGNLYGTTVRGGAYDQGTVFQLVPPTVAGARWTQTILYNFAGFTDGGDPENLIFDAAGNLYGNAFYGGDPDYGTGVVFKLSPPATSGGTWTESVLHAFNSSGGMDGSNPSGNLIFDAEGNLYGVTAGGGAGSIYCGEPGCGVVFELKPPSVSGGSWTEAVIYEFFTSGTIDGFSPNGVLLGPGGVVFGTTSYGGTQGLGTFFKLTPPLSSGSAWLERVLYNFGGTGADGRFPSALTAGKKGILYGTTGLGGSAGNGTVFELTPPTSGGIWTESVLYNFSGGSDGAGPAASVELDSAGNLYGTTTRGGSSPCAGAGCGTVYELIPPATSGDAWTETTLHDFSGGHDGQTPGGGNLLYTKGVLFGTTEGGGTPSSYGTVYRIVP
jgi:uncharacterized repeat protein (TIGR03803 family)